MTWYQFQKVVDEFIGMSSSSIKQENGEIVLRYGNPLNPLYEVTICQIDGVWQVAKVGTLVDSQELFNLHTKPNQYNTGCVECLFAKAPGNPPTPSDHKKCKACSKEPTFSNFEQVQYDYVCPLCGSVWTKEYLWKEELGREGEPPDWDKWVQCWVDYGTCPLCNSASPKYDQQITKEINE